MIKPMTSRTQQRVRKATGVGSTRRYVYDDRDRLKKVSDTMGGQ